jgi:hypothetical protein
MAIERAYSTAVAIIRLFRVKYMYSSTRPEVTVGARWPLSSIRTNLVARGLKSTFVFSSARSSMLTLVMEDDISQIVTHYLGQTGSVHGA